jgi:hypothetical protein
MLARMTSRPRTANPPAQRLTSPGELLQAVPYLVGFHPSESVVIVGLRERRVAVTARLDLADARAGGIGYTLAALARAGSTAAIGVIYADDMRPDDADERPWQLLECLQEHAAALDGVFEDVLLVAGGRWWSLLCAEPSCCPLEGQELPCGPSAFATAATVEGMVALPDRGALEAVLEPAPDAEREALDAAIGAAERFAVHETVQGRADRYTRSVKRAIFAAARASAAPKWPGLGDEELARFGAALAVIGLRDAMWLAIEANRIDGRPLWRELARRLPAPYDCAPLFLYGWAAWRDGNGALAGIAAERAIRSDPEYSASYLLLAAVRDAIDPRRIRRLRMPKSA